MKITVIGDIHGRIVWKEIVDREKDSDLFVFMGDYFDSYEGVGGSKELANFLEILNLKEKEGDRVILLAGNHDYHYLPVCEHPYSRYIYDWAPQIQKSLEPAIKEGKIQACYVHDNFLFIHAGLTKTWAKNNNVDLDSIEEYLNNYFLHNTSKFGFTPGRYRSPYGDEVCQSPFWVRPASLMMDAIDGYNQIVGHTQVENIEPLTKKVILVDGLGHAKQYLVLNDKKPEVRDL